MTDKKFVDPMPIESGDRMAVSLFAGDKADWFNLAVSNTSAWQRAGKQGKFDTNFRIPNMQPQVAAHGPRTGRVRVHGDKDGTIMAKCAAVWDILCEIKDAKFIGYGYASCKDGRIDRTWAALAVTEGQAAVWLTIDYLYLPSTRLELDEEPSGRRLAYKPGVHIQ